MNVIIHYLLPRSLVFAMTSTKNHLCKQFVPDYANTWRISWRIYLILNMIMWLLHYTFVAGYGYVQRCYEHCKDKPRDVNRRFRCFLGGSRFTRVYSANSTRTSEQSPKNLFPRDTAKTTACTCKSCREAFTQNCSMAKLDFQRWCEYPSSITRNVITILKWKCQKLKTLMCD